MRIVALNLAGSIAFQVSAFASFIRPSTGELANIPIANLGTFVGAVGFLLGALLLFVDVNDAQTGARATQRNDKPPGSPEQV